MPDSTPDNGSPPTPEDDLLTEVEVETPPAEPIRSRRGSVVKMRIPRRPTVPATPGQREPDPLAVFFAVGAPSNTLRVERRRRVWRVASRGPGGRFVDTGPYVYLGTISAEPGRVVEDLVKEQYGGGAYRATGQVPGEDKPRSREFTLLGEPLQLDSTEEEPPDDGWFMERPEQELPEREPPIPPGTPVYWDGHKAIPLQTPPQGVPQFALDKLTERLDRLQQELTSNRASDAVTGLFQNWLQMREADRKDESERLGRLDAEKARIEQDRIRVEQARIDAENKRETDRREFEAKQREADRQQMQMMVELVKEQAKDKTSPLEQLDVMSSVIEKAVSIVGGGEKSKLSEWKDIIKDGVLPGLKELGDLAKQYKPPPVPALPPPLPPALPPPPPPSQPQNITIESLRGVLEQASAAAAAQTGPNRVLRYIIEVVPAGERDLLLKQLAMLTDANTLAGAVEMLATQGQATLPPDQVTRLKALATSIRGEHAEWYEDFLGAVKQWVG